MRRPFGCVLILLFLFSACRDNIIYNEFNSIPSQTWSFNDTILFDIVLKDTVEKSYDIHLLVRYRKDYEFSNIWLMASHNIYGANSLERVEATLFSPDGRPKGEVFGNYCTLEAKWKKNVRLSADSVTVSFVQNMRKNPLPGIMDIGLKIVPAMKVEERK